MTFSLKNFNIRYLRKIVNNFYLLMREHSRACPAKRRWKLWLFRANWLTLENSSLVEVFFNGACVNIYDTFMRSKLLASLAHCDLVFGTQNEFSHFPRVRRGGEQLPSLACCFNPVARLKTCDQLNSGVTGSY